jgi:S1-C subfamily serine protease
MVISPGNSGGALVNAKGRVVGINVAYIPPAAGAESLGFAIPAPTVRDVVTELFDTGRGRHALFGVRPGRLIPEIARRLNVEQDPGVLVLEVTTGSPAASAGIAPGDVLLRAGERELRTVEDFLAVLRARGPGDSLEVALARGGDERTVTVRLGERP